MKKILIEKKHTTTSKLFESIKTYNKIILSTAVIIVLILIVYGRDLEIILNEAIKSEALGHILLLPFLAGTLFYLKRDIVKALMSIQEHQRELKTKSIDGILGITLCLVAFLTYWYGSYTFYPLEYHLLSLPIFLMGIVSILFNFKVTRALIFPLLFLLFLIPPPTEFIYILGGVMANFNTQAAYLILRTFGLPVTLSSSYGPPTITLTNSVGDPTSFKIDIPCSGIYSMTAFAMFAAFLSFITMTSVSKKIYVLLLGFLTFDFLNILRISTIISVAHLFGEELAMVMFHSVAGLILTFIGIFLILLIAEKILKIQIIPTSQEQTSCPKCKKHSELQNFCSYCGRFLNFPKPKISTGFLMKTFLLIVGCLIVTMSINAPIFAIAQGPIDLTSNPGDENTTDVFPSIPGYQLTFLYRDRDYEKIAHQDASLIYAYFPTNKTRSTIYVVVGVADSISNLHSWEVCLITWQTARGRYPLVQVLDSRNIHLLPDVPIIAQYLVFVNQRNYTQITLYWYEKATFKTGITVEQKYVRISLIILKQNLTEYKQLEDELLLVGQSIASYWEPLKSQSIVSLGIPAQQLLLTLSIGFIAFTKIAQHTDNWRKKNRNLRIFNNFASPKEKIILQTIQEMAEKMKTMETRDILIAIKEKTGKNLSLEELINILNRFEAYGFIRREVISVKNSPRLVWKT